MCGTGCWRAGWGGGRGGIRWGMWMGVRFISMESFVHMFLLIHTATSRCRAVRPPVVEAALPLMSQCREIRSGRHTLQCHGPSHRPRFRTRHSRGIAPRVAQTMMSAGGAATRILGTGSFKDHAIDTANGALIPQMAGHRSFQERGQEDRALARVKAIPLVSGHARPADWTR